MLDDNMSEGSLPEGQNTGEEEFVRIEKELEEKLRTAKHASGEDLTDGEKRTLAKDFYLGKLREYGKDYVIQHKSGFGGKLGRFFAFISGREKVTVVNRNNPRYGSKEFKISWVSQTPGQDLVDFLKRELKEQTNKMSAGSVATFSAPVSAQDELNAVAESSEIPIEALKPAGDINTNTIPTS